MELGGGEKEEARPMGAPLCEFMLPALLRAGLQYIQISFSVCIP